MNYDNMTDQEINEAVAKIIGTYSKPTEGARLDCGGSMWADEQGYLTSIAPDYCDDPSHSFNIIFAHGIGIAEFFKVSDVTQREWRARFPLNKGHRPSWGIGNENPLRAAMIVFLMMQEGK